MSQFKRAVLQFASNGDRRSWSEVYYHRNPSATLQNVQLAAIRLLRLRTQLFGVGIRVLNSYVSDDDTRRDALYIEPPQPFQDGTWNKFVVDPEGIATADYSWSTLLLRFVSGNNSNKTLYLSGIPDFITYNPQERKPFPATFQKAFDAYIKELTENWAWKGISTDPQISPIHQVRFINYDNGSINVETQAPHGLAAGTPITISKVKSSGKRLNMVTFVKSVVDLTNFTVQKVVTPPFTYLSGGQVQVRNFQLFPMDEMVIRGWTSRRRGNSVGGRRGRRTTRS